MKHEWGGLKREGREVSQATESFRMALMVAGLSGALTVVIDEIDDWLALLRVAEFPIDREPGVIWLAGVKFVRSGRPQPSALERFIGHEIGI